MTGSGAGAQVELFAVSADYESIDPNGLYSITDTLDATSNTGETFTELETSPGEEYMSFKGVAFAPVAVPEPAGAVVFCIGIAALRRRNRRSQRGNAI